MSKDVWWEWFSSLFPSYEADEVDPYTWTCIHCGYKWRFNKLELLKMFLFDDYTHTCPQCQWQSRYRMITHVVREIDSDEIRENNRWL